MTSRRFFNQPENTNRIAAEIKRFREFVSSPRIPELRSRHSGWNARNLIERFAQPEYESEISRIATLGADVRHFVQEFFLERPITQFSYTLNLPNGQNEETIVGEGYHEPLTLLLANFAQNMAERGLSVSRAEVEQMTLARAQRALTELALSGDFQDQGLLITSFPDDITAGYAGSDSKKYPNSPRKKERYHSFYYLMYIQDSNHETGKITVQTTQYRVWHNAHQALELHKKLGRPVEIGKDPVPNVLYANIIPVTKTELLTKIAGMESAHNTNSALPTHFPNPTEETLLENAFRSLIYSDIQTHSHNYTQAPHIIEDLFWKKNLLLEEAGENPLLPPLFADFYLSLALPRFSKAAQLLKEAQSQGENTVQKKKLYSAIQKEIDELDRLWFYYQQELTGLVAQQNQNPATKKQLLPKETPLGLTGLTTAFSLDLRVQNGSTLSKNEKKQLTEAWNFFSTISGVAYGASSGIQCGVLAPFTFPLSVLKRSFSLDISLFSHSLEKLSLTEKQRLLVELSQQNYVELDLRSKGAQKIWSVPTSYLEGNGCIVGQNGEVLGPCIDPTTNQRIALSDPRDTLAFPMSIEQFMNYRAHLEEEASRENFAAIEQFIDQKALSSNQKQRASALVKKIKKLLLKETLGVDALFNGITTRTNVHASGWLQQLLRKLVYASNPIHTLQEEVSRLILEKNELGDQVSNFSPEFT